MSDEICDFLSAAAYPLRVSFFISSGLQKHFNCFGGDIEEYKNDCEYSVYDIRPLVRTLIGKSGVVDNEVYEQLWNSDEGKKICLILNWDAFSRQVIVFDTSETINFSVTKFSKLIIENKDKIKNFYKNTYYRCQKKRCLNEILSTF